MEPEDTPRTRIRLDAVAREARGDGFCLLTVRLELCGEIYSAARNAIGTQQGLLKASAEAALDATLAAAGEGTQLDLVGVKAVRAFDGWVVVCRLNTHREGAPLRLLGAAPCEAESELIRAAAQSVLAASNRILEPRVPC